MTTPVLVSVISEFRFHQTPDGRCWTPSSLPYTFWSRYLDVFAAVRIVARALPVASVPPEWKGVDGPGVTLLPVPHYVGVREFLWNWMSVRRRLLEALSPPGAIILRVGSTLANLLVPHLIRDRHPFALEVGGSPDETFAPGVISHPLRAFARWWFSRNLVHQCRVAPAVSYVTDAALQAQYPPSPGAFVTSYSSIELADDLLRAAPREATSFRQPPHLISIGSMEQPYKGFDTLLTALSLCRRRGLLATLRLIGSGRHLPTLRALAAELGVGESVVFVGAIPSGQPVIAELDAADLFVLPSRTEGLPRALVEAMARGLPAIGSRVGGIPELLPPDHLVHSSDAPALAQAIIKLASNPNGMAESSRHSVARARDFRESILRPRRIAFYQHLRSLTERHCVKR